MVSHNCFRLTNANNNGKYLFNSKWIHFDILIFCNCHKCMCHRSGNGISIEYSNSPLAFGMLARRWDVLNTPSVALKVTSRGRTIETHKTGKWRKTIITYSNSTCKLSCIMSFIQWSPFDREQRNLLPFDHSSLTSMTQPLTHWHKRTHFDSCIQFAYIQLNVGMAGDWHMSPWLRTWTRNAHIQKNLIPAECVLLWWWCRDISPWFSVHTRWTRKSGVWRGMPRTGTANGRSGRDFNLQK